MEKKEGAEFDKNVLELPFFRLVGESRSHLLRQEKKKGGGYKYTVLRRREEWNN